MERRLVHFLISKGLVADRVPLSGAAGHLSGKRGTDGYSDFGGDVVVRRPDGGETRLQLKAVRGAAATLRKWMGGGHALVVVTHHGKDERFADDPNQWLVVMRLGQFYPLLFGGVMGRGEA